MSQKENRLSEIRNEGNDGRGKNPRIAGTRTKMALVFHYRVTLLVCGPQKCEGHRRVTLRALPWLIRCLVRFNQGSARRLS